jgi:hypothetical protein
MNPFYNAIQYAYRFKLNDAMHKIAWTYSLNITGLKIKLGWMISGVWFRR